MHAAHRLHSYHVEYRDDAFCLEYGIAESYAGKSLLHSFRMSRNFLLTAICQFAGVSIELDVQTNIVALFLKER